MREGADGGFAPVLDEVLGEGAFVDQEVGALRQPRDAVARLGVAGEHDDLAFRFDAEAEAGR